VERLRHARTYDEDDVNGQQVVDALSVTANTRIFGFARRRLSTLI